jgi:hypothetical protein
MAEQTTQKLSEKHKKYLESAKKNIIEDQRKQKEAEALVNKLLGQPQSKAEFNYTYLILAAVVLVAVFYFTKKKGK